MPQGEMGRLMENHVSLLFFRPSEDVEWEHDDVFPGDKPTTVLDFGESSENETIVKMLDEAAAQTEKP
jgi:hypothetical protein